MYLRGALVVTGLLALMACGAGGCTFSEGGAETVPVFDDTHNGWFFKKSLPRDFRWYGYKIVTKDNGHPVRDHEKSMRFEVRPGDCSQRDCTTDRERHELKSWDDWSSGEYWYHWSLFLPQDFPIIYPVKVALGQFHQEKSHVVWMFQNARGGYHVHNQTIGRTLEKRKILTDGEMRGRWSDILVNVRWTDEQDGFFRVYVNGETTPRYTWSGPTKESYTRVYYKLGIYRSFISRRPGEEPTQVVYYDHVNRAKSCEAATRYFDCAEIRTNQKDS